MIFAAWLQHTASSVNRPKMQSGTLKSKLHLKSDMYIADRKLDVADDCINDGLEASWLAAVIGIVQLGRTLLISMILVRFICTTPQSLGVHASMHPLRCTSHHHTCKAF